MYAPGPVGVAESRRVAEIVAAGETLEGMRALDPLQPQVSFERYEA